MPTTRASAINILLTSIEHKAYLVDHFRESLEPHARVFAADSSRYASGLHAAERGFIIPPGTSREYLPTLLSLCATHDIGTVVATEDAELPFLADAAEVLAAHGVFACISSPAVIETCWDKYLTYELMKKSGIGVPCTYLWNQEEELVDDLAQGIISFPILAKPRRSGGSKGIHLLHDTGALIRDMREVGATGVPEKAKHIFQEFIDSDQYSVHVFNNLERQPVKVIGMVNLYRRFGPTWQIRSLRDPELVCFGQRVGLALGSIGPITADVHKRADGYVVLEINPRFGGCYSVSHYAGADFPRLIAALSRGEQLTDGALADFRDGVIMLKQLHTIDTTEQDISARFAVSDSPDATPREVQSPPA